LTTEQETGVASTKRDRNINNTPAITSSSWRPCLRDLLLVIGGFFFGVGLMIQDELFMIATSTSTPWDAKYDWAFPPLHWESLWTSWGIDFVWILSSVLLLVFAARFQASPHEHLQEQATSQPEIEENILHTRSRSER
jgi:hypothetical protein